jgi:hypothetical protein
MYFQNRRYTLWRPSHFRDREFLKKNYLEEDFPSWVNRPYTKQAIELTLLPPDSEMKEWSYSYPKVSNTASKTLTMFVVITGFTISRLVLS